MNIKNIAALVLSISCGNAFCLSQMELCNYRGRLVESFAIARDAGVPERQTVTNTKKELEKLGSGAGDMKSYIELVYARRDVAPEKFRLLAKVSCLQE